MDDSVHLKFLRQERQIYNSLAILAIDHEALYKELGKISLGQRIRNAKSMNILERFIAEMETYTFASPKTQRRWKRLIEKKLKELHPPE